MVFPEGLCVVADVVDCHKTDAREETEHAEELPEFRMWEEGEAADVEMGRFVVRVRYSAVGGVGKEGCVF